MSLIISETSPAAPAVNGTSWLLRRLTAHGVTASLSSDVRAHLAIGADGSAVIETGFLRGAGRLTTGPGVVEFGQFEVSCVPGACVTGTLEERIVNSCGGVFDAALHDGVLHLRRDGVSLEFVETR